MHAAIKPSIALKTGGMYAFFPAFLIEKALECGLIEPLESEPGVYQYSKREVKEMCMVGI